MSQGDPFLDVKGDVEIALTNADTFMQSWQRILRTVSSANSEELTQARTELEDCLNGVEEDLLDLTEAMQAIEVDPRRFQITQVELVRRRQFIDTTQQSVKAMRDNIIIRTKEFKETQERKSLLQVRRDLNNSDHVSISVDGETLYERNNEEFIEQERMQQMMIIEQQDVHLDAVMGTVTSLKQVAFTMNDELDRHHVLLEELEDHVDRSQTNLDRAAGKVKEILRKSRESRSNCCITILIIVLVILLILVITI
ncbi:syntaxin 6, N-terminal-domain-containing protein [Syncephalis fuscata]|nr:syntaxin 6, N-terminal-domain-containing protein [Syncephalis fuscata]